MLLATPVETQYFLCRICIDFHRCPSKDTNLGRHQSPQKQSRHFPRAKEGWPGVQGMPTSAGSRGLQGNKGRFVAERVKSRPVACRPLCLKRSLPAPTKQEQMVHCFKGFSETKEQDQITFPQRQYLQKAFALIKDSSLFSSQHFIHHIGFWGGGEASIVYCASLSSPRDQEGI